MCCFIIISYEYACVSALIMSKATSVCVCVCVFVCVFAYTHTYIYTHLYIKLSGADLGFCKGGGAIQRGGRPRGHDPLAPLLDPPLKIINMYVYIYTYIYVYIYMCIYIYIYIYIYVYTHIHYSNINILYTLMHAHTHSHLLIFKHIQAYLNISLCTYLTYNYT